ncbi:hypothetical protein K0T92_10460 [Paenibacillus oenotherae]|uniref:Uncharacterized protein n=1 Tax=Paenibacillus oenotherae TaxID=1435645 RepID=A0ABS7D5K5_9BACL|nr:hypothetical protein [Paenibacillus oenotherae]MBW7475170.1 hypothetical protein [Paenibacillus oenotherae]
MKIKDNSSSNHIHTSQPASELISEKNSTNEHLLPQQIIEGGGPPARVQLNMLPRPVRWFAYLLMAIAVIMAGSVAIVSFFH